MRRIALVVAGGLTIAVTQLRGLAAAQDEPLCGPPGGEVPATIVGSGLIVGTSGDDVIVGSDRKDTMLGLGGNDTICGEGGNDPAFGGVGNDNDVCTGGSGGRHRQQLRGRLRASVPGLGHRLLPRSTGLTS